MDLKVRMLLLEEGKVSAEEDCTEAILEVANMATAVQGLYLANQQVSASARSRMVVYMWTCMYIHLHICLYIYIYIYVCKS